MAGVKWRICSGDSSVPTAGSTPVRPELTCLQVAARNGHADLVVDLLDVWDGWPADEKRRALYDAASAWRDHVVALLLDKVPYDADNIQYALERAVENRLILPENEREPSPGPKDYLIQQRLVCRLVDAGGNPKGIDSIINQPLVHKAVVSKQRIGALRGLLERNADPNVQDSHGRTALHHLFGAPPSSVDALRILLQYSASPEIAGDAGETPLHVVANPGTLPQLPLCLRYVRDEDVAVHLRNLHGESLLHYAAAGAREDIFEFLLSRGLHINASSSTGWTPLMCVLAPNKMKTDPTRFRFASVLLHRGASARVVTEEGWTPLHALATTYPLAYVGAIPEGRDGAAGLARELISHGAHVDTESGVIRSPSVNPKMLYDLWGYRMQRFTEDVAASSPTQVPGGATGTNTTPRAWAQRSNAMDIFDVLTVHLASATRDGAAVWRVGQFLLSYCVLKTTVPHEGKFRIPRKCCQYVAR